MVIETKWIFVNDHTESKIGRKTVSRKNISVYLFHVENESILVKLPTGKHILYDCGKDEEAAKEIYSNLRRHRIKKIDVMIASHPHFDHAGGFMEFANIPKRKIKMGDLYDNGDNDIDDCWFVDYKNFRDNLPDGGEHHSVNGETKLNLGKGVEITLYVNHNWNVKSESSRKYRSVWMKINYKNATILFSGDSKSKYEKLMIKDFPSIGTAHVVKLSEHGSKEATKEKFIQTIQPIFAVACNKHHDGLPDPLVRQRLGTRKIFSTNVTEGKITVRTDGKLRDNKVSYKIKLQKN